MLNLLLFNLKLNQNYAPLSFTNEWVNEFSKHYDNVYVLTMDVGDFEIPNNVKVFTIEHQNNENNLISLLKFYLNLFKILKKYKINHCFSHMNILFSTLSGIILKFYNIPLITWYAHPSNTFLLKLSHLLSYKIVTSFKDAYPIQSSKVYVVGQGINTELFKFDNSQRDRSILYAGRISRSKNIHILIYSFSKISNLFQNTILNIVGSANTADDKKYYKNLIDIIKKSNLQERVIFYEAVPRNILKNLFCRSRVFINLTPKGFGDKVALEAISNEIMTIYCNESFNLITGAYSDICFFKVNDSVDLAKKIKNVLEMSEYDYSNITSQLSEEVKKSHSIEKLPTKIKNLYS